MNHIVVALLLVTGSAYSENAFEQIVAGNQAAAANAVSVANQGLALAHEAVAGAIANGETAAQSILQQLDDAQRNLAGQAANYASVEVQRAECEQKSQGDPAGTFQCFQKYLADLEAVAPAFSPQVAARAAVQNAALNQFQQDANAIAQGFQPIFDQAAQQLQAADQLNMPPAAKEAILQEAAKWKGVEDSLILDRFHAFQTATGTH